jgi:hypothetical protein
MSCTTSADCGPGDKCCLRADSAMCAASCAPNQAQLCLSAGECASQNCATPRSDAGVCPLKTCDGALPAGGNLTLLVACH